MRAVIAREEVDLVILDLVIPGGMGGEQTIKKIREINPKVKAILSTAVSSHPVLSAYQEHGFKAVLPKPYTPEKLLETILMVLTTS